MYFREINLRNWRNISQLKIKLEEGLIVITGANAQGKSNFLEALYLLARGTLPRPARDEELITWGEELAYLSCKVQEKVGDFTREVIIRRGQAKEWRVNGRLETRKRRIWLVGYFPQDMEIVEGSPSKRRDFLDQTIDLLRPGWGRVCREYGEVLYRRNTLLREKPHSELIEVYTEKLVSLGTTLVRGRIWYLQNLTPFIQQFYRELSGEEEEIQPRYQSRGYSLQNESEIKDDLRQAFREAKAEELSRGFTLVGPHRDEVVFQKEGRDLRTFGSQGEKKTLALSLKLAEMNVVKLLTGEKVIVVLDDLFSELDEKRRKRLWSEIVSQNQVFVTTTEKLEWEERGKGAKVRVLTLDRGKIYPEER